MPHHRSQTSPLGRFDIGPMRIFGVFSLLAMSGLAVGGCDRTGAPEPPLTVLPSLVELFPGEPAHLTASDTESSVIWMSEAPDVATVTTDGTVTGSSSGSTKIWAESQGRRASATIVIHELAVIQLSDTIVSVGSRPGEPPPTAPAVEVTNGGGGILGGLTVSPPHYDGIFAGWLRAKLEAQTAPTTIDLQFLTEDLPPGEHRATVEVMGPYVQAGPRSILVVVRALKPAEILVSPDSLLLTAQVGSSAEALVAISNGGEAPLDGLSADVEYPSGTPTPWLSLALDGMEAPALLIANANADGLTEGVYEATIHLSSTAFGAVPARVLVRLKVEGSPRIGVTPSVVSFSGAFGRPLTTVRSVSVTNTGGGVLSDLSVLSIYHASGPTPGATWLRASLTGTTAPASLDLSVETAGLSPGVYKAEVRVGSSEAPNSTKTVFVELDLVHLPAIQIPTRGNTAYRTTGRPSTQFQELPVYNKGGGTLSGLYFEIDAIEGTARLDWLEVRMGGDTAPAKLWIRRYGEFVPPGLYVARVSIKSTIPGVLPHDLRIVASIRPTTNLTLSSSAANLTAQAGQPGDSALVTITNGGGPVLDDLFERIVYYQGEPQGWLSVGWPPGPRTTPNYFVLKADATGLPPGTYRVTLLLLVPEVWIPSASMGVTLTVH